MPEQAAIARQEYNHARYLAKREYYIQKSSERLRQTVEWARLAHEEGDAEAAAKLQAWREAHRKRAREWSHKHGTLPRAERIALYWQEKGMTKEESDALSRERGNKQRREAEKAKRQAAKNGDAAAIEWLLEVRRQTLARVKKHEEKKRQGAA